MKSSLLWFACSLLIVICWCGTLRAQDATPGAEKRPTPEQQAQGGIATLYALDPLARAVCFHDGREGLMFRNNKVARRCNDLSFNPDKGGSLVTGTETNRPGAIVDLGTADELRARYGQDVAGVDVGFASLRLHGEKLAILVHKEDRPQEKVETLKEAQALLSDTVPSANAPVTLGHIYVARIVDTKDSSFQVMAKLMVIAYKPNESVTVRWQLL